MVSEGQEGERSELEKPIGQVEAEAALNQAREMSEALNRINAVLHSTLDFGEIMQRLVAEGSAFLGSESAAISLRRGDGWTVSHVHGMPSSVVGIMMEDDKERHAVLALQSRQPVAVADAFNDKRFNREHLRRHNISAVLVAPLIIRNEGLGVIFFNYHSGPHEFTDAEVNFALQLATTAAIALENAQFFDEHKRAKEALRQAKYNLEITVKERTAELQRINERLREENQQRVQTEQLLRLEQSRLDALLHLSRIGEASLKEITEFTLEQAIALSHSKIGFLGFMNEDESLYTLHAVSKNVIKECNVTGDPLQWHVIDAGIWADAIRERKTLFVNDYSKPHPSKKGLPLGHPHVERFMVVPIIESERVVAVAGVGNKASEYDKSDERQIVLLLSGMCGYLQKERSREDLQKAYNELEERTRELAAKNVELKESHYLLEKTFASLDEVVLLVDLADPSTRRIIAANPAAKRVFGYSEEELIGRSTEMLHVNKAMFERFGSELAAALDAKGVYQCEFQMRRKDGSIIFTEHIVSEVLDESGKRTGFVSGIRDISQRKAAEKKLLAYQNQLRSLSLELSLIGERERRKLAEDLHDSVAQLLVLSKFNLEDVLAKSSLGAGRTEIEEVCQYLGEAMEQTRSLMFELSPPYLHAIGLKDGLGGLAKRIEHAHNLQVDFSADEIPESALNEDASILLYRSVQELLMNIVKHSGVSQAKLSLFKDGDAIRVEVEDEGSGYDLSSAASDANVEKKGGFGLLSIKERLFHLGGQFEISSKPGKGTRATLTVPLTKETIMTFAEDVAPIRVLIADDHQMVREGLRSLLESQNFEILGEAKDGEEAIRIARETTPDVVIMDIEMPVTDGVEATRRILAELPEIRVIGLSMHRDKSRISQALESGASGFVLKDSAFHELNQAIHAVVNDKSIFLSAAIRDLFSDSGEQPF